MNVPFFLRDEALEKAFLSESKDAGPARAEGASRRRRDARIDLQRDAGAGVPGAGGFHEGLRRPPWLRKSRSALPNPSPQAGRERADAAPLDLVAVRTQIDGIDGRSRPDRRARAVRATGGQGKGKLAAAVDYYRPEREAMVLRGVVDRNDGPLADDVLVRLFREIMSACLAQQEPLKIGYLGPEGTFSQQAVQKHFGIRRKGCRWRASRKCSTKSPRATRISASCRWRTRGRARSSRRSICSSLRR
jgi:chorismate mutase/prephenate dehydratase